MKKILIASSVVLFLAASCGNKPQQSEVKSSKNQNQAESVNQNQDNLPQGNKTGWEIYTNSQYGFTFQYPKDYELKTGEDASDAGYIPVQNYFVSGGEKVVTVSMPEGAFGKDTDFDGAFFNVSISGSLSQQNCQKSREYGTSGKTLTVTQNINGTIFYKGEGGGGAAGHQAEEVFYHAYYGGKCFELIEGLRTAGYGAVESITKQVDFKDVTNRLDQVLSTFKFTNTAAQPVTYKNTQYGFNFNLPSNWKGYKILTSTWEGYVPTEQSGDKTVETGPIVTIRSPKWTSAKPYQDIPVMVFTIKQWNDLQMEKFHIGAAPVNPGELGRNSKYVFALPARYNFADAEGIQEVNDIIQTNPLIGF